MVAVVPSTLTVRAELAAKPWAVMVALVPTGPDVGVSPVAEAVTVKLVAEVAVFDEASVTTTLWAPLGTDGTVKVTVEDPLVPVVAPAGDGGSRAVHLDRQGRCGGEALGRDGGAGADRARRRGRAPSPRRSP